MPERTKLDATKSSVSGDDDELLFSTLRSLSGEYTNLREDGKTPSTDMLLFPTFSNVSLSVAWFVCVFGAATCYLFCEVHQASYPAFPLDFVTGLGAQLTVVSSLLVYVCGVHRYGRRVYRFYQPFSGGTQFVTLQGLGALCLALSLCVSLSHLTLFDVHHVVRGVYVYCAVLSVLGSALLMTSIRWFNTERANSGRSSVTDLLLRKPNAETTLSICLMLALLALCALATQFPDLKMRMAMLTVVIHIVNGLLIHFFIGARHVVGYTAAFSPRYWSPASAQMWWAWLTHLAATAADIFLILHPSKMSAIALTGLMFANVMAGGFLLLVVRFTKFQQKPGEHNAPVTTVIQYGSAAAILSSIVMGSIDFMVTLRLHTIRESAEPDHASTRHVNKHVESSNWTWGDLLQLALFVSKSVAITVPILTQVGGRVVFGSKFMWFNSHIGRQHRSFVLLQVTGWWFFILSVGFFGLFVVTDTPTFGAVMSLTNVFSVACLAFSVQEFARVEEKEGAAAAQNPASAEGSDGLPSTTTTTTTKEAAAAQADAVPSINADADINVVMAVNASFAAVFNGTLLLSYLLAASGLALRVLLDTVRSKMWDSSDQASQGLLFALSSVCFILATPVAHYSARQLGMKMFDPFRGGGSYVALQVLGWTLYALLLVTKALGSVVWHNRAMLPTFHTFASSADGYWFTMFGVLDMIPVVLITLSNMVEARRALSLLGRREAVREAIEGVRTIMQNYTERCRDDDERALARFAFRALAGPAYDTYRLPYSRKDLELSVGGDAAGEDNAWERDSDDSDSLFASEESRVRHESVLIIVLLMACVSAAFYVIAAFTWNIPIVTLSMASCGFVICAVSCITTHAGYGVVLKGAKGFKPFMPFRGGAEFIKLQLAGWTCFACVLLVTLTSVVETVETSVAALLTAGALSVTAQVLLLDSIPRFSLTAHASYFLEHNSEVVVAVLCFVGAITFGNVYAALKSFVTSSDESINARKIELGRLQQQDLADDDRWVSTKLTRVPFVVAIVGVTLAVPLVLIALGRTTRQATLVAKKQRASRKKALSKPVPDDDGAESVLSADETDPADRSASPVSVTHSGYKRWRERGGVLEAFSNLMQILLMLSGAILPFSVGYVVYSVSRSVSVESLETVDQVVRWVALVLFVSIVLSLVPYLLHVGVPSVFINLRFTIVTWAQYGLAVVIASTILGPVFVLPCMGTITSAVLLFALTLLGNFSKVRLLFRMILSGMIGYRTYTMYLVFRHNGVATGSLPHVLGMYTLDMLLLVFWLRYIPSYDGKPYHTGSMRSNTAINFARRFIFSDVVRYFRFKIVMDDDAVHMRDSANQYIFSFHPHGVFPGTALFCALTEEWEKKVGSNPDTCLCTHVASIIFNVPGVRDYNLRLGSISVARRSIEASLARGNSAVIVTGGQAEMLHTKLSDREMTLVTQHMGFIRLAIKNKVPLVPLLSFAEHNLLGLLNFPRIQKVTLKILGFPLPFMPYGRFGLPVPFRTPLTLVVGTPIPIPPDADADNAEDVKRMSDLYFSELKALFYRRRADAGYPEMELVLINDKEERQKRREAAQKGAAEKSANKKTQ